MEANKEDLGLVIATPREAIFIRVRDVAKDLIKHAEEDLVVYKENLKRAEEIIKEEKDAR